MSKPFEVTWEMYGTATVEADNMQDAIDIAGKEFIHWSGMGLDVIEVSVDGAVVRI